MDDNPEEKTHRRRKRRHKRKFEDAYQMPGVVKLVLSEFTQKIIGCVAGEDVTAENSWKYVDKEIVLENMELHDESSDFLPVKDNLIVTTQDKILVGYIPNEIGEVDEFYVCVTETAQKMVAEIIENEKKAQEERLYNSVYKTVKEWNELGSSEEIKLINNINNRPLMEIEVRSKYPLMKSKVHLKKRTVEDVRDGYMELLCTDESRDNIYKKRIDNSAQTHGVTKENEAQTICNFPSNIATQYHYDQPEPPKGEQFEKKLKEFEGNVMDMLEDQLHINGSINFYSDDFETLVKDEAISSLPVSTDMIEYMTFMDVELCKNKMVACAVWHPMWTGIVAISYMDYAPCVYVRNKIEQDEVNRAVHGMNPVLIWSMNDMLKPKLVLEAPREVQTLSFCEYDENVLIGGCINGQVIIWDLSNRLDRVEKHDIVTTAQMKYKLIMASLMDWMKNIEDISVVRPAAVSDLRFSHKGPITAISWFSPFYELGRTGRISCVEEGNSKQFYTSSLDGSFAAWDLNKSPVAVSGGFRQKKTYKRLEKRPSGLTMDVSKYRAFHLNHKPIYKVNIIDKMKQTTQLHLTSFNLDRERHKYVLDPPNLYKKVHLKDRIIYRCITEKPSKAMKSRAAIGCIEGVFAYVGWDGSDFDSGEVTNSENCTFINYSLYHDGPISQISISHKTGLIVTLGGKVFACWKPEFSGRPVIWRKRDTNYTIGGISPFYPGRLTLAENSGILECWMLFYDSCHVASEQVLTSGCITSMIVHPTKLKKDVIGIGDDQGIFRLRLIPKSTVLAKEEINDLNKYMLKEISRKRIFIQWQEQWKAKNKIEKQEAKAKAAAEPAPAEEPPDEEEEAEKKAIDMRRQLEEQRKREQEERTLNMILEKKQLKLDDMNKKREPLQKIVEEKEKKKRKQRLMVRDADNIFQETVATLFPDFVKDKEKKKSIKISPKIQEQDRQKCFKRYKDIQENAYYFVKENQYDLEFDWKNALYEGRKRKEKIDDIHSVVPHLGRYAELKKDRMSVSNYSAYKEPQLGVNEESVDDMDVNSPGEEL